MSVQCKAVLRQLRILAEGTHVEMSFVQGTPSIIRSDDSEKAYDYTKYQGEILSIIAALVQDGYLVYTFNSYHFCLTDHGLHPHQHAWVEIRKFLIKSVLVPIVVSLATTLITLAITELLR